MIEASQQCEVPQLTENDLGTFDVVSGALRISDPCHEKDIRPGNAGTIKAANGTWQAVSYTRRFDELLGERAYKVERICELEAFLDELRKVGEPYSHEKLPYKQLRSVIGVDSAQAGIFDLSHFQDNSLITPDTPTDISHNWYGMCCDATYDKAGIIPFGVVSESGFGDGLYTAYVKRNSKHQAVAVKIVFIDEDDIDDEDKK
jgi:hypothetical protein